MDFADLLQFNIELYDKNIDLIISYTIDQKNYSSYADKLFMIGENTIKKYLFDNPDFMEVILNEIKQRQILIKLYKQKIQENMNENMNDPIKKRMLKFGLKLVQKNLYEFKNEHKKIFKKNIILI
jgi:hypothetical protein